MSCAMVLCLNTIDYLLATEATEGTEGTEKKPGRILAAPDDLRSEEFFERIFRLSLCSL